MTDTPFTFGGMIADPQRFIKRVTEREQIVVRLTDKQQEGSAMVGGRRIGSKPSSGSSP